MSASHKPALLGHEGHVVLLAVLPRLPGSAIALWMLWGGDFSSKVQWTLTLLIAGAWLGCAFAVRERVVFPLQTLSNLLGALREGDFSVRGRPPRRRPRRSHARGQYAGQHAPRTAPRRHGGHHAIAHRDARNRRGHLCVR